MVDLDEGQRKAVEQLSSGKVLWGGTGSGKTRTALAYFHDKVCKAVLGDLGSARTPKDLYVITTAKKRDTKDWQKAAVLWGISENLETCALGIRFVVDSFNNLEKYKDVKDSFFIFDEQRLVGTGKWSRSFISIAKKNEWILLSATPGEVWMDYASLFIANGWYRNVTDFREKHVVFQYGARYSKIKKYVEEGVLLKHKRDILVELPYSKKTFRHFEHVYCDWDEGLVEMVRKGRWNPFTERPVRGSDEAWRVIRKIVNSDQDRIRRVREVLVSTPRVIIFYNFDYELEALRGLRDEGFEVAELNGHRHDELPKGESWVYLVQYSAGAEGWECTSTDTMIFFSLPYSYKLFEQAQGRIDRRNTGYRELTYFVFRGRNFVDLAIWRALSQKKNFVAGVI